MAAAVENPQVVLANPPPAQNPPPVPPVPPELVKKCFLGLTAAIIATISFQLATNPSGGVVQESLSGVAFLISNTISLIASLGVLVSVIANVTANPNPNPNANANANREHNIQDLIRRLSIGLYIAITSLTLSYLFAASMVTPTSIWPSVGIVVWTSLAVIGVYYIIHSLQPQPQPAPHQGG